MTDPIYSPATAFGNKELLKRCPEIVENKETEEEEKIYEIEKWSSEANEYRLTWICVCGVENDDAVSFEPEPGDEVECYRCTKKLILK